MRITFAELGKPRLLVRLSCLALISLASCARADPPELFAADPRLQNDFNTNLPASGSSLGFNYNIVQGQAVLEGDILLGEVDENGDLVREFQSRGVGPSSLFYRWPDGIIIYESPTDNSQTQQSRVAEAIEHWENNSRLEFIERTSENASQYPNYIVFTDSTGCASYVGMIGGAQEVFISDNCSVGSVIHEIGHAIGLFHEHTRPDRDTYITVDFDAITTGAENNFTLLTSGVDTYSDYDYGSIMHYGEFFFSNSSSPTIIINDANTTEIGQRIALSDMDILSSNAMYATDLQLGTPVTNLNGNTLEIDVTAYNMGEQGANDVELAMQVGEGSSWQVSTGSDWECITYSTNTEIKCTLDVLYEFDDANLVVNAILGDASEEDLSIRLVSRTLDSQPDNNTFNDTASEWNSLIYELYYDAPSLGAATSVEIETETDTVTDSQEETDPELHAASSASAGGSVTMALLILLMGCTLVRSLILQSNLRVSTVVATNT